MITPTTPDGLRQYDELEPLEAVRRAWVEDGPHPEWQRAARQEVRRSMPLLARALDRPDPMALIEEHERLK